MECLDCGLQRSERATQIVANRSEKLAAGAVLHARVTLGERTSVGARSELHPGVVLYPHVSLGEDCIVHSGAVIGADGFGLISYWSGDLKVAHCADATCSSAIVATLDSAGSIGPHSSIAIGVYGRGLISYYDVSNGDLKAAHLGIGVP